MGVPCPARLTVDTSMQSSDARAHVCRVPVVLHLGAIAWTVSGLCWVGSTCRHSWRNPYVPGSQLRVFGVRDTLVCLTSDGAKVPNFL